MLHKENTMISILILFTLPYWQNISKSKDIYCPPFCNLLDHPTWHKFMGGKGVTYFIFFFWGGGGLCNLFQFGVCVTYFNLGIGGHHIFHFGVGRNCITYFNLGEGGSKEVPACKHPHPHFWPYVHHHFEKLILQAFIYWDLITSTLLQIHLTFESVSVLPSPLVAKSWIIKTDPVFRPAETDIGRRLGCQSWYCENWTWRKYAKLLEIANSK